MRFGFVGRVMLIALACAPVSVPAAAQEIYAPNYFDGDVSVLDARTLGTLARIPVTATADASISVTGEPSAVEFSLDHRLAFVVISNSDRVAVIDTVQRTVIEYIVIAPVTFDALIFRHPDGQRLYVTSCADPIVSVISVQSRQTTATLPLPAGSYAMAFSADGSTAYLASGYPGCGTTPGLYRLNTTTNSLIGFTGLSQAPSDVAVAPSGLFALTSGGSRILVVDLTTNREAGSVQCGALPCNYSATGTIVFNSAGNRGYTVDSVTNQFITIDTDAKSRSFLQELSRVTMAVPDGTNVWQLALRKSYAYVASYSWDATGVVVTMDVSTDMPVMVGTQEVGTFAYELVLWSYPTAKEQCDGDGWTRFGLFGSRGACVSSISNQSVDSRWFQ